MIYLLSEGPLDHWQTELEKTSKAGLIELVERLLFIYSSTDRDGLLRMAQGARSMGRHLDAIKDSRAYVANPDRWLDSKIRQKAAAKKAARRRKKEKRVG